MIISSVLRSCFARSLHVSGFAALLATGSADLASAAAPVVTARVKPLITEGGAVFKDLNANGRVDPYEDWRLPVDQRVDDLVRQMTLPEKAGMLLIDSLSADAGGRLPEAATNLVKDELMTRFILRSVVVPNPVAPPAPEAGRGGAGPGPGGPGPGGGRGGRGGAGPRAGAQVTPFEVASFTNAVQELAEGTRLGIPVIFKSNARNHYEQDARPGINVTAGSFSEWPKEAGLAATRDLALIGEFAEIMRQEWTSIGLRGMYGYMADLATEPRWYRVHETFTEDADLAAEILTTLVRTLQGPSLGAGSVAMTLKHFPGAGPQEGGGDPHYWFGRNQVYPAGQFAAHVKPFKAAIDAGVAAIMPYYGIPVDQPYQPNTVGMAFSKGIVTDLLRGELGFKGYVNSDTGIIGPPGQGRAWGLEDKSVAELLTVAIEAGTDVLSGFRRNADILALVTDGRIPESRLETSVRRLLVEQFQLGLFENPYVDPVMAAATVGKPEFRARADYAQRKSIVLLHNDARSDQVGDQPVLPLPSPSATNPIGLYVMGMKPDALRAAGYAVTSGDRPAGEPRPAVPAGTRYAVLRINVSNTIMPIPNPATQEPVMAVGMPPSTTFGGAIPDEVDFLAFSDLAKAKSWVMTPSLAEVQAVMAEVGAANTVLAIYFRQPYVLDEASGLRNAGAIVGLFGASDAAIADVVAGKFKPQGKLPFALAKTAEAIRRQAPDAPGYDLADTLYPFGFGKTY